MRNTWNSIHGVHTLHSGTLKKNQYILTIMITISIIIIIIIMKLVKKPQNKTETYSMILLNN